MHNLVHRLSLQVLDPPSTFPSSILCKRVPLVVGSKVSHTTPEVVTGQVVVVSIAAVKRLTQTPQIESVVNVLRRCTFSSSDSHKKVQGDNDCQRLGLIDFTVSPILFRQLRIGIPVGQDCGTSGTKSTKHSL